VTTASRSPSSSNTASAEAGYPLALGAETITPVTSLTYSYLHQNAYGCVAIRKRECMRGRYKKDCLDDQRTELRGGSSVCVVGHLPLANHMHELDARKDDARAAEISESHHWPDDAFDGNVNLKAGLGKMVR
jgi:Autotransporter beta-domain